jgi:hypothetical protein
MRIILVKLIPPAMIKKDTSLHTQHIWRTKTNQFSNQAWYKLAGKLLY